MNRIAGCILLISGLCSTALAQNEAKDLSASPLVVERDSTTSRGVEKLSKRSREKRIAQLSNAERLLLDDLRPLMSEAETDAYLIEETSEDRASWLDDWLESWNGNLAQLRARAAELEGHLVEPSDASRAAMIHGLPAERHRFECEGLLIPLEVWRWTEGPLPDNAPVLFYAAAASPPSTLFFAEQTDDPEPADPREQLLTNRGQKEGFISVFEGIPVSSERPVPAISRCEHGDDVLEAIRNATTRPADVRFILERLSARHEPTNSARPTSDLPTSELPITVSFPGKRGSRTSAQFSGEIEADRFPLAASAEDPSTVEVEGVIHWNDEVVDRFRYIWNSDHSTPFEFNFERALLPDDYTVDLTFSDQAGNAFRVVTEVPVPYVSPPTEEVQTFRDDLRTEALLLAQDYRPGESRIRIVPPALELMTGFQRFDAIATGSAIHSVEFWLENKPVLTRRLPPYTAELDLGKLPLRRRVAVLARNQAGQVIAGDELLVNAGRKPWRVRIISPRVSDGLTGPTRVEVQVDVPERKKLKTIDLLYNDVLVARGFEEQLIQIVTLPDSPNIGYLRAVATLDDANGTVTEDVVFINTPDVFEQVDVRLVELPVSVFRKGDPVNGLLATDFKLEEGNAEISIERFDYVDDLPLSIGLAIDTSGSMKNRMSDALEAAARFFEDVLSPADRAFVVSFDTEATLVQPWTESLADLSAGLSTLEAEDYTALYDAVITSLFHFQGIQGQKALVLLTDGEDTASTFTLSQMKEYARRAGVPIYPIALGFDRSDSIVRSIFTRLADETGGEAFFIQSTADLSKIYSQIDQELRSQYILGFYPSREAIERGDWREVRVRVENAKAKTVNGYYP